MPASPLPRDADTRAAHRNGTLGKKMAANDGQNMNGNDFAKAIGINRPANVKDKIKRWQQEVEPDAAPAGGAAEDAGAGAGASATVKPPKTPTPAAPKPPKTPTTPKTKPLDDKPNWRPAHTPRKSVDVSPERPQSAKKTPVAHNELDEDLLTATAPKKRVISDSHWRQKQSPPKDAARPAPKTIPNAWVRPSKIVKLDKPLIDEPKPLEKPEKPAAKGSAPLTPPVKALVSYVGRSTGQKKAPQRQRRPSKPSSSENEQGSGSAGEAKSEDDGATPQKDKIEVVRMRRKPRARTPPLASRSADDLALPTRRPARTSDTSLVEDAMNVITVEYEESRITSPRDDEIRERRRRRRPKSQGDATADQALREPISAGRRRRRRSSPKISAAQLASPPRSATPESPPNKSQGNRMEAWLQATPDPFMDTGTRRRRKSKDSVSQVELPPTADKSDITTSTELTAEPVEEERPRSSGSGSRRRRRRRSREMQIDTQIVDEPSSIVSSNVSSQLSDDTTATPTPSKDSEVSLTSTPTLKRRGAKRSQHSPTKSRSMSSPLRETTSVDDAPQDDAKDSEIASTAPSSSVDASAIDFEILSLRPRPLALKRGFPSTGKRLSTIVSEDSFAAKTPAAATSTIAASEFSTISEESNTITDVTASEVGSQMHAETSTIVSRRSTRRKKLATHADLMSVLSMPKPAGAKSIVSARSIRTNRSRLATATAVDIMGELASDEIKYMRELRTLVDGVIPVLLSCVLSKSDSAVAAGLFSRAANTDPSHVTKPIVDMGVSLERLKTLHKRVPKEDPEAFVSWAQSAQRVYADYIASWRLGFQDVVISLASADDEPFKPAKIVNGPEDGAPWDEGMPRNAEGYVVNGDGERVDVAYMLKRPLVRLKYLAKSLRVSATSCSCRWKQS
jgi:hypothetical protein